MIKPEDLKPSTIYTVRYGKPGPGDVDWQPPFETELPLQFSRGCLIYVSPPGWAEYVPEDYDDRSGVWLAGDYYMEIIGERAGEAGEEKKKN